MIPRAKAAALGQETVIILGAGEYQAPSGRTVDLRAALEWMTQETRLYRPVDRPRTPSENLTPTIIEVTDESTLAAARRLDAVSPGCNPCCLNFASAKHPGGGFLGGARAQEESLARASGLYTSLLTQREMYDFNRSRKSCLYSDYMIYSPHVPVFRDDEGTLLEEPFIVSFVTAPAVNVGALDRGEYAHIEPIMRLRAEKVLGIAHAQNHRHLILGAWGCGVFRNDSAMIADLFATLLEGGGPYHHVFEHVVFAVLDYSDRKETFTAFHSRFASFS